MRGFCYAPDFHLFSQVIKYVYSMYMYDDFDLPNLVIDVVSSDQNVNFESFTVFNIFVINPLNVRGLMYKITLFLGSCRSVALRFKKNWDEGPSLVQTFKDRRATYLQLLCLQSVVTFSYHIHTVQHTMLLMWLNGDQLWFPGC